MSHSPAIASAVSASQHPTDSPRPAARSAAHAHPHPTQTNRSMRQARVPTCAPVLASPSHTAQQTTALFKFACHTVQTPGPKSSRTAMKFVLRRPSTYQHGISTYEKYTTVYCHVLPCTATYCQKYVLVRTCTYFWSFLCTSTYQYVLVCTAMQKITKSMYLYYGRHTIRAQGCTRRYVPVCQGTNTYRHKLGVQNSRCCSCCCL
jgi:hypothetical protein